MSSERNKQYFPANKKFRFLRKLVDEGKWDDAFEIIKNHEEVSTMMDPWQYTALHHACVRDAPLWIIEALIRRNPDATNVKDFNGSLPLHRLFCGSAVDPIVLQRMIEANPSAKGVQNGYGLLPLHFAACNELIPAESFEIILDAYPEGTRVANAHGEIPLHTACHSMLNNAACCRILSSLMQANPDAISTANNDGHYPFHHMMERIVGQLNPESVRGFKMILDANSDVARTPFPFYNMGLPLHNLFDNPPSTDNFSELRTELVAILLKTHPRALIFSNNNGQVPLHIAVKKWPYEEEYGEDGGLVDNPPPAEYLLEFHCQLIETLIKANPSAASIPDNEGRLALHLACKFWPFNVKERLSVLLAANQNALDHVDSHGKTPLQYAFERESDAHEFVAGLFSVTKQVQIKKFQHTIMANEGLSVGLAGARKGLDKEREKNRLLEEEIAELKEEIEQLRS